MTNPQSDRLSRVENLVEENAMAINSLIELATIQQSNIEVQQQNIEIMQAEIKGIQLENRRLIERFFGTEENQ